MDLISFSDAFDFLQLQADSSAVEPKCNEDTSSSEIVKSLAEDFTESQHTTGATNAPTPSSSSVATGDEAESEAHSGCCNSVDNGLPTQICTYYAKGIQGVGQGCLRVNCKFFHGTEEQLAELRRDGGALDSQRVKLNLSDVDLGEKRPIVCLAYLTNACRRPGCRFLHLPANIRPLPIAVCECFTRGTCNRRRCRFFHGTQEVLTRMHAKGVTMYNPMTNEAHDPSTSLEELIKLQERTTVPLSAAGPAPVYIIVNQPTGQAVQSQVPSMHQPHNLQSMGNGNVYAPFGVAPQQPINAPLTFAGSQQQQHLPYQPIPHQYQLAPQATQQQYPQPHIQPHQQTVAYPYSQQQHQHHDVQRSAGFTAPVPSHLTSAFPASHTMGPAALNASQHASQHAYLRPTILTTAVPHQAQHAIPHPFAMQHQAFAGVPSQVHFQHPPQPPQNLFNPQHGGIYY